MSAVEVGDELLVIVWRDGLGDGFPLAAPLDPDVSDSRRIRVEDGTVDSVVRIRVYRTTGDAIVGTVVAEFDPDDPEWTRAEALLTTRFEFQTAVVERQGRPRLTIRASKDFQRQWERQKRATFEEMSDHP